MKRLVLTGLVVVWTMIGSGCIAVASRSTRIGTARELVAVEGRVYMVDKRSGAVREIDLSTARPFDAAEDTDPDVND